MHNFKGYHNQEANKKEEQSLISMAEKNAKQALIQKLYETQSNISLINKLSKKFKLKSGISLIEVYDNSHIQGTDCIGGLITFRAHENLMNLEKCRATCIYLPLMPNIDLLVQTP